VARLRRVITALAFQRDAARTRSASVSPAGGFDKPTWGRPQLGSAPAGRLHRSL